MSLWTILMGQMLVTYLLQHTSDFLPNPDFSQLGCLHAFKHIYDTFVFFDLMYCMRVLLSFVFCAVPRVFY